LSHTEDPLVRVHPEPASLVFQYAESAVAEKPVLHRDTGEFSVLESGYAAVVTPDPENMIRILIETPDVVACQPVVGGESPDAAVLHGRQPTAGAHPDR